MTTTCARFVCSAPLPPHTRGEAPRYCSDRCRATAAKVRKRYTDRTKRAMTLVRHFGEAEFSRPEAGAVVGWGGLDVLLRELEEDGLLIALPGGSYRKARKTDPRSWDESDPRTPPGIAFPEAKTAEKAGNPDPGQPVTEAAHKRAARSPEGTDQRGVLQSNGAAGGDEGQSERPSYGASATCAAGAPSVPELSPATPEASPSASIAPQEIPAGTPQASGPRLLGWKLDGGTSVSIVCSPPPELLSPAGSTVELVPGVLCEVTRPNPYAISLVHAEATLTLTRNSAKLTFAKRGLRGLGETECVAKWLDIASLRLFGLPCASLDEAEALGWSTSCVELALDVVGFPVPSDAENIIGLAGRGNPSKRDANGRLVWVCSTGNPRPRDGLGMTIQDKSQWALDRKGGSTKKRPRELIDHPIEGPLLRDQGLQPGETVTRIEMHPHGRALIGLDPETGEVLYDLRSIRSLLDPEEQRRFWGGALASIRYVTPGDEPAAKRPTRPEWEAIRTQAAGAELPAPERLAFARRRTRELSDEELERRLLERQRRTERDLAAIRRRQEQRLREPCPHAGRSMDAADAELQSFGRGYTSPPERNPDDGPVPRRK